MNQSVCAWCSALFIVAVIGGATLQTIIVNDADDSLIIRGDLGTSDNQNMTGSNFDVFNATWLQEFFKNISIPKEPSETLMVTPQTQTGAIVGTPNWSSKTAPRCYSMCVEYDAFGGNTLGFSVGGAKDINNFRENIEWGYLPLVTDITYEGLFYDYYFNTGQTTACDQLFCPSYTYAVTINPLTGEQEYYMTVGLNSGLLQSEFERKKLNLVIVLDISGSMSSSFNRYYYNGIEYVDPEERNNDWNKSKLQVACESIVALMDHLQDDDRLGIILFESESRVMEEITLVKNKNMVPLKRRIMQLQPEGGTNMDAGMQQATSMIEPYSDADPTEYENRIIFLTDAQPNTGDISEQGLLGQLKQNSENRIYTTFVGIGVDFNSDLVERITKTRGANYYSVHSSSEFMKRMDDEFEFMVTPLVFDLQMHLISEGYEIVDVFGSPDANESTGQLMKVSTLFPSARVDEETKGGIVVLQLRKVSANATLGLEVSYEDRQGQLFMHEDEIVLEEKDPDFFQNSGIRKGILLVRYATLMKKWITYQRSIVDSPYVGPWERKSLALRVSEEFKHLFSEFSEYFNLEMIALDDETLQQELDVLHLLGSLESTEIKCTGGDTGQTIIMEPGALLNVTLVENEGWTWKINDHDDSIIYLTESFSWSTNEDNPQDMKTWVFKADNMGNTTLLIEHLQDDVVEDDYRYIPTFTLTVEVE